MKLYKLTDQNGNTQGLTKWAVGITHKHKRCENPQLCSGDIYHAYTNINLAYLLNPEHANINNPIPWECKGTVAVRDYGKVGCFSLTITKRLDTPAWVKSNKANMVRVAFAILCAESVIKIYEDKYPSDHRPRKAVDAAREYLLNPTSYAAYAAADAAADAAMKIKIIRYGLKVIAKAGRGK